MRAIPKNGDFRFGGCGAADRPDLFGGGRAWPGTEARMGCVFRPERAPGWGEPPRTESAKRDRCMRPQTAIYAAK